MFDQALQILGLVVGLFYLYYEYHADNKVWIASIIMPVISLFVYFRKGLYADFSMNIYYLVMAIYGYLAWTGRLRFGRKKSGEAAENEPKKKEELAITHMPLRNYLVMVPLTAIIWVGIAQFLIHATNSTVPWTDAFTTALSIVGIWMLARKYLEQWVVWIVVDAVCVYLYVYKAIYPYALLYGLYTVIAAFGYRKWLRMMRG